MSGAVTGPPRARVVKAFNTPCGRDIAANPRQPSGRQPSFLAGDGQAANDTVAGLADEFGFAPSSSAACATAAG